MPTIVWVVIGIIFIIVWGTIIIEIYNAPTMSDSYDLEEDKMNEPLTREFLLNRGFCCDNGCKNCPY
tara:strand:- start:178 stop:378 length:201 start_codon:yes stop_codon:yes gene_type:complete